MKKSKVDTCEVSYSKALEVVEAQKPKTRFTTKLYFWAFVLFTVLSIFLFWSSRGQKFGENKMLIVLAVTSIAMATMFAFFCFIRFIRARSIVGGLFLTTCISTGVFLVTSQAIPAMLPRGVAAFSNAPEYSGTNMDLLVVLSQIGLFALWFAFLLFTIFLYVRPVKKIDKYLLKIINGDKIKRVKIGHARQYKAIEEKIRKISTDASEHRDFVQANYNITLLKDDNNNPNQ